MSSSSSSPVAEGIKRHRLAIDLDPKAKGLLDELTARSGNISNAELFRRSLALYNAVLSLHEQDGAVIFRHADGHDERLLML